MLLMAVDIGNTNVVIGFIDDGRIAGTYRITTKANHTSDEYGLMITQFLALSGYKPADVDDVIISSVVPKVMHSFRASIVKFLDIDPMIVGPGIKTGLNIQMENPAQIGSDLIVAAVAALSRFKPPLIIVDMGTATTMTAIDKNGTMKVVNSLFMLSAQSGFKVVALVAEEGTGAKPENGGSETSRPSED